ncbi:MAG: hypothetical protein ACI85I_001761 [Arenicella sp.]|jgi:hypothetical protein
MKLELRHTKTFYLFLLVLLCSNSVFAQTVEVQIGRTDIAANEAFKISVVATNGKVTDISDFPNIRGLRKVGVSQSQNVSIVNGRMTSSISVVQNYSATREGSFKFKPFTMVVNGKVVKGKGGTVKVGPARVRQDPFAAFFGGGRKRAAMEFIDVKDGAFVALSTDKSEVFVGEGFTATLAFYMPFEDRGKIDFTYSLGDQLTEILKTLKPANSWEENFGINKIAEERVELNGKWYLKYKIYQATYYPLNSERIAFPSVGLKMKKYKFSKNRGVFGRERKEDFKTFYTSPKSVSVKQLPPHPLRDLVNVGEYKLAEEIESKDKFETSKSFGYRFRIQGKGNISSLKKPDLPKDSGLLFYPPNTDENISRNSGIVYGSKQFEYNIEPSEPGKYNLGDFFQWIYFNPKTAQYDTLKSEKMIEVVGESQKNQSIASNDLGDFYSDMDKVNNQLMSRSDANWTLILANLVVLLALGLGGFVVFANKNTPELEEKPLFSEVYPRKREV